MQRSTRHIFQFLMTHFSSKLIHVLNKSTIITNINVKGALSIVKVIQSLMDMNCLNVNDKLLLY